MISGAVVSESDGEDAAGMEPAHAAGEDPGPVEVAGLEQGAGLVRAVVEDDRRAHAVAAVAVDRGDIGPADAVVLEPFVERRHAGFAHAALHELADRVVDHGGGDAGLQSEAVGQAGGDVVFAAGDVDLERARLAERDHARVEPVHERTERQEIELAGILAYFQVRSSLCTSFVAVRKWQSGRSAIARTGRSLGDVDKDFERLFFLEQLHHFLVGVEARRPGA